MNRQQVNILIKELEEVTKHQRELEYKINQYFMPIIRRARNSMNKKKLEQLLDEVPDSLIKLALYQAIREIDIINEKKEYKESEHSSQSYFDRQKQIEEERARDGDNSVLGNPAY